MRYSVKRRVKLRVPGNDDQSFRVLSVIQLDTAFAPHFRNARLPGIPQGGYEGIGAAQQEHFGQ